MHGGLFQVDEDYVYSRLLTGKYNIRSLKISFSLG